MAALDRVAHCAGFSSIGIPFRRVGDSWDRAGSRSIGIPLRLRRGSLGVKVRLLNGFVSQSTFFSWCVRFFWVCASVPVIITSQVIAEDSVFRYQPRSFGLPPVSHSRC